MTDDPTTPDIEIASLADLMAEGFPVDPARWGPWTLRADNLTLQHPHYEIDLERCLTAAAVLDWIMQVAAKTWADPVTLAGLVRALDDVLHPQGHLCSWGEAQAPLTAETLRRLVDQAGDDGAPTWTEVGT